MRKLLLLTLLSINCFFTGIYAASYISFNNVYVGTVVSPKISTGSSALSGSSFKLNSANTFTNVGTSAHAIYDVTFTYSDASGNLQSYVGMVQTDINNGSASLALIFEQTTALGVHTTTTPAVSFILAVPKYQSSIVGGTQYSLNGNYKESFLPPITLVQDNNSAPNITSSSTFNIAGGLTKAGTITATDANNNLFVNSSALKITGGTNMAKFNPITTSGSKSAASGDLNFITAPTWSSSGSNAYNVQVTATDSLGTTGVQNITVNVLQPVVSSTSSLSTFSYVYNSGPSGSQSFTVSGTNLYSNVTVTAPTDFEISTTAGGAYSQSLPLTYSNSTLSSTTIYIRLKSGKAVGTYSGDILVAATDAVTKTISISGRVNNIVTATENVDNKDIFVYTDASNNIRILNNTEKRIKMSLYTISGNLISENIFSQSEIILKKNLQAGIYIVSVKTDNGVVNKKIIIR